MSDNRAPVRLDSEAIDRVIQRLKAEPPASEHEIQRIYRRLMKATHPDHTHDDGHTFLYLQRRFDEYRAEWVALRKRAHVESSVERHRVLEELGLRPDTAPRAALFASLYRFRALGLSNYRVRTRPALRRRNGRVIRTVVAWAYEYDEHFVEIFYAFLRHHGRFSISERHASLYFMVRKLILKGLDGLIRYQDLARPATSEIARDTVRYALFVSEAYRDDAAYSAVRALGAWILEELAKPPEPIGLDL